MEGGIVWRAKGQCKWDWPHGRTRLRRACASSDMRLRRDSPSRRLRLRRTIGLSPVAAPVGRELRERAGAEYIKGPGLLEVRALVFAAGGYLTPARCTMETVTVAVWVFPPPVAVTVRVEVPTEAFLLALMVMVEAPDPVTELGLKLTLFPLPCPDAEKVTAELKPPEPATVRVEAPEAFWAMDSVLGDAEKVKSAVAEAVTVSETVVVCVTLPPVPVMVMG